MPPAKTKHVDMRTVLAAAALAIAGCGGETGSQQSQIQSEEEEKQTATPPIPALSAPLTGIDRVVRVNRQRAAAAIEDKAPAGSTEPITILALVTPYAEEAYKAYYGSVDLAMRSMQASTNRALYFSGALTSIIITDVELIAYDATTANSEQLVADLRDGVGAFANVHNLRDAYAADVVILFAETLDACGMAYESGAEEKNAFGVVAWQCSDMPRSALAGQHKTITPVGAFAHEVGHLIGCDHDPDSLDYTPFAPDGLGYCTAEWQTLMAVESAACDPGVIAEGFSSPDRLYDDKPTGAPGRNHCVSIWNRRAQTVSDFR